MSAARALARLDALRFTFTPVAARAKRRALGTLLRARCRNRAELERLHEAVAFVRAYPDDARVLAAAERIARGFAQRADLAAHRRALAGSGIAGTDTPFRYFAPTALALAQAWPARLAYDWREWDDPARLEAWLPLLAVHAETPALDEWDLGLRGWLRRMTPRGMGDAAWVTRRLAARLADPAVFERVHDGIDAPMVLGWGAGGPSRTTARAPGLRVHLQRGPLRSGRPDLRAELTRPPRAIRGVSARDGERFVALAREAMVARQRDLDAFAYADPRDVRLVDCGDGLVFAAMGLRPERRLLLESVYGFLTLKNGVPTGYVLTSALHGSAEIAYNVFETYRGGEAGAVYGRVLAMTRALFGVDAFTIYPYQLGGGGNEEGLASGAWWFYRKLGFAPADRGARALVRREEARMRRDPAHRSTRRTLMALAEHNVYWHADAERDDVIGRLPLANVGLAVTDLLARRFGDDERGAVAAAAEATRVLGAGPGSRWSAGERLAFTRWAPLVLALRGLSRWPAADRRALLDLIRAKGGRRESDFVRRYDAHARLRAAVAGLASRSRP